MDSHTYIYVCIDNTRTYSVVLTRCPLVQVFINKIDTIRSYHVEVRHIPTAASGIQVFKAIVSTPGGATDREWSAVCAINAGRGMVKVDVHTPFISMNVNGSYLIACNIHPTTITTSFTFQLLSTVNILDHTHKYSNFYNYLKHLV